MLKIKRTNLWIRSHSLLCSSKMLSFCKSFLYFALQTDVIVCETTFRQMETKTLQFISLLMVISYVSFTNISINL